MVRSTTIATPSVDVTRVDTAVASSPGTPSNRTVVRDNGASVRCSVTVMPSPRRNSIVTGASTVCGFASSRSVSKNVPVAPSAR